MSDTTIVTLGSPPTGPQASPQAQQTAQEAFIHALIGAPFGDLEFDIGKSVRWTQWFSDDVLITDVNLGEPRYWVVNWDKTFPEAHHNITGVNYFVDPVGFRKAQFAFALADPTIILEDADWVLFVDAAEGMSVDDTSPPNDVDVQPFRSYIYREIQRAVDTGKDHVVFPFLAFLRHTNIGNVEYLHDAFQGAPLGFSTVEQSIGIPYYLPNQGLARLWKVSALKAANFDWTKLDQFQAPDAGVKVQLVSYCYAHWNEQDIVPPATTVPPLTASNDDGWRQRQLISKVRPVPGLPYQDPWKPPAQDPVGEAGPWAGGMTNTPDVGDWHDGVLDTTKGRVWANYNPDNLNYQIQRSMSWRILLKASITTIATNCWIVGVGLGTTDLQWALGIQSGALTLRLSTDGTTFTDLTLATNAQLQLANGQECYFGVDFTPLVIPGNTLRAQALRSDDGDSWTLVGPVVTQATMQYWASESDLALPPQTTPMVGTINTLMIWDADTMTEICRFDADEWPQGSPQPTSYVGKYGTQWETNDPTCMTPGYVTPLTVPPPTANTQGVLVPLYDCVFRINLRDGVWYDAGQLGNVPLIWNETTQTWDPVVSPVDWANDAYVQQP